MDAETPAVKPKRKYVTKKMRQDAARLARRQRRKDHRAERLYDARFDMDVRNFRHAVKQHDSNSNQPRQWPGNMERWTSDKPSVRRAVKLQRLAAKRQQAAGQ